MDRCPTAMGMADADVLALAVLCPGPGGHDEAAGLPVSSFPPRYRDALTLARAWKNAWDARQKEAKRDDD